MEPSRGPPLVPNVSGCRVLLTRPRGQADDWRRALEAVGAEVVVYPTIEVGPPPSWAPLDGALAHLGDYDWLIFSSASAVRFASARLPPGVEPRLLDRPMVAAVGHETARALAELGFRVSVVPTEQRQEGLTDALGNLAPGTRVLFPQALGGRQDLVLALRAGGCTVDVVPASATTPRHPLPPLPAFDVATFASPSALRAFVDHHGVEPLARVRTVVIGPTTAAAAQGLGISATVAREPNIQGVIEAISAIRSSQGAT